MTQEVLAWDAHAGHWQRIVNELPIPPRRLQRSLSDQRPVLARIEWPGDGTSTSPRSPTSTRLVRCWCYSATGAATLSDRTGSSINRRPWLALEAAWLRESTLCGSGR